jgi:glycogen debranching enzyme
VEKFLTPMLAHLDEFGLGHISEIADADAPHTPRGCPFQAWSVGELLRLERQVLAPDKPRSVKKTSSVPRRWRGGVTNTISEARVHCFAFPPALRIAGTK